MSEIVTLDKFPEMPRRRGKRKIELDPHDEALMQAARAAIVDACNNAHSSSAVARCLHSVASGIRRRGYAKAVKKYPFKNICEKSGLALTRDHAQLDELDPMLGYEGPVRWVCAKANGNGKRSCGGC
jgi:hypothetical protein